MEDCNVSTCKCGCGEIPKPGNLYVCYHHIRGPNNPFYGKKHSVSSKKKISDSRKGKYFGENNPFYGKKHSEETRLKNSLAHVGVRHSNESKRKHSITISGPNNHFYGKAHSDKTKEVISNSVKLAYQEGRLKKLFGESNSRFGKSSPVGSGRGIDGWLANGMFFRSSCEARFILENISSHGGEWISGESARFAVEYVNELGNRATYFPDFFHICENKIIEVKPFNWERLPTANEIRIKREFAEKLFSSRGMSFQFILVRSMSKQQLFDMRRCGVIVRFANTRIEKQYYNWLLKQMNGD